MPSFWHLLDAINSKPRIVWKVVHNFTTRTSGACVCSCWTLSTIWGKEHSRNPWCFKFNLAASANSSLHFVGTTRKSAWVKNGNNIDPSSSWYFTLSVSLASKIFPSARRRSLHRRGNADQREGKALHRRRHADQREDKAFADGDMRTSEKTKPSPKEKCGPARRQKAFTEREA